MLYSSGTTGLPKAIVHGHGGIALELLKSVSLHLDLGPADRFFWFTTTGWMMWNFLVGGLLAGSAIVLYDGQPDPHGLWAFAERAGITCLGTSASFIGACMKAGVEPPELPRLRSVGSTGSPLPVEGFDDRLGFMGGRFLGDHPLAGGVHPEQDAAFPVAAAYSTVLVAIVSVREPSSNTRPGTKSSKNITPAPHAGRPRPGGAPLALPGRR